MTCCTKDEGRPFGTALQEEVSNHRKRLGAKALVVSVTGKGEARLRQVGASELNASEPLLTCRKLKDVIKTGIGLLSRDESGGSLQIGQMVTGTKAAGPRHRLWCGTWEPTG